MPYEVTWQTPEKIILVKVLHNITEEDVFQADVIMLGMLESSLVDKVHIIFDDTQADQLPPAKVFTEVQWVKHPRVGQTVSFGAQNSLTSFFSRFVMQFFHIQGKSGMNSLEEALAYLQETDPSLQTPKEEKNA